MLTAFPSTGMLAVSPSIRHPSTTSVFHRSAARDFKPVCELHDLYKVLWQHAFLFVPFCWRLRTKFVHGVCCAIYICRKLFIINQYFKLYNITIIIWFAPAPSRYYLSLLTIIIQMSLTASLVHNTQLNS